MHDEAGAYPEDVRGERLVGVHFGDVEPLKRSYVHPVGVHQDGVIGDSRHGGLQVEAPGDPNRPDLVSQRLRDGPELTQARCIGTAGLAHPYGATCPKDVPALQRAGWVDSTGRSVPRQLCRYGLDLGSPRCDRRSSHDGDLVQHDRRVFHEDGVRELGRGGHLGYAAPERLEQSAVAGVLPCRRDGVDRLAWEVRELAPADGGAHGPGEGDHGESATTPISSATGSV